MLSRLSELFADAEFEKALALAQSIPDESEDHVVVETCERECRRRLEEQYLARIGPLERTPRLLLRNDALKSLTLDHRTAFVVSHVDAATSYESLLDVSGLPPFETLRILDRLLALGVIG
jgi:hypothetical protein